MTNKIITNEGYATFIYGDGSGKVISTAVSNVYTVFNVDTVSFVLIGLPKSSGLSLFTTRAEDLELNGVVYSMAELPDAVAEAFSPSGIGIHFEVVETLPASGESNVIYLVPASSSGGNNNYEEYIWLSTENRYEFLGTTSGVVIDLPITKGTGVNSLELNYTGNTASGDYSVACGKLNNASSECNFIAGNRNSTSNFAETVFGQKNITRSEDPTHFGLSGNTLFVVGNGIETEFTNVTHNAFEIRGNGDIYISDTNAEGLYYEKPMIKLQDALGGGGITSGEVQTMIDTSISGKADSDDVYIKTETSSKTEISDALALKSDTGHTHLLSGITDVTAPLAAINSLTGAVGTMAFEDKDSYSSATEVNTALALKADKANAVASAEYVSSSTTIDLKNIDGTVISQVDATDFIVDGMVDDVRIETLSGVTYLVIDFNTASGKEDILIPLSDIFDPSNYYTKAEVNGFVGDLEADDNYISGVVDTKLAIADFNVYSGLVDTAINEKLAVSDFNTYSGEVVSELSTKALQSDLEALSGVTTAHTADTSIHLTTGTVQTQIDSSISGKANSSDVYLKTETSGATEISNALADKADIDHTHILSAITDVTAPLAAINSLTGSVGTMAFENKTSYSSATEVNTALAGKSDTGHTHVLSAITDVTAPLAAINSLTGAVGTMAFENKTSYSSATEVNTALAGKSNTGHTHDDRYYTETEINARLGGLTFWKGTHAQYQALSPDYDNNTIYIIKD